VRAYIERGEAYRAKGQYDAALADLDQAVGLDRSSPAAFAGRGLIHRLRSDYDRAIADYNVAVTLDQKRGGRMWGAARRISPRESWTGR